MRWKINHALAWVLIFMFGLVCGAVAAEKPVNTGEVIAKIRKQCYAILQQAMKSEEAFVRSGAARAVGESEDPGLIPLLEKGAKDFYPTTRQFALQGISGLSKKKARILGRERLEDSNIWVKSTALGLLADLNDTESIDTIKSLLKAPDRMVRLAAAYTLVRLGEAEYFDELTRAVKGGDTVHRFQAITYLGKIGDEVSLRQLKDLLESDEEQVLSASLKALGERADMELFRPLVKLSLHKSPTVRRNAVLALGHLPPKAVNKEVKLFCTDPDPLVQLSAALAMHRLKSTECREVFTNLMGHKDYAVRASTARVLGKVDIPDRTRLLAKALGDPKTRVRTAAVRAAGQMGGPEAFQLLIQMLDDPQEVIRAYAAGNLLRLMKIICEVGLRTPIQVGITLDVVFVEDVAELGFDEDQQRLAGIGQAVFRAFGDDGALAFLQNHFLIVAFHLSFAGNHQPVFGAVLVRLQAQAFARQDFDALQQVSFTFVQRSIATPRLLHGGVQFRFRTLFLFQFLYQLLDVLRPVLRADQQGVRRIHHDHVFESHRADQASVRLDEGAGAVDLVHVFRQHVAVAVGSGNIIECAPRADIAPRHGGRHHRRVLRGFHDGVVDGDRRQRSENFLTLGVEYAVGKFALGVLEVFLDARQRSDHLRSVLLQFLADGEHRPREDAAVPVIFFLFQKMLRRFAVWFFCELADLEGVVQLLQGIAFQDIAVTRLRARRLHTEGDQVVALRRRYRLAQGFLERVGIAHHMIGGENRHDLLRLILEQFRRQSDRRGGVASNGFGYEMVG